MKRNKFYEDIFTWMRHLKKCYVFIHLCMHVCTHVQLSRTGIILTEKEIYYTQQYRECAYLKNSNLVPSSGNEMQEICNTFWRKKFQHFTGKRIDLKELERRQIVRIRKAGWYILDISKRLGMSCNTIARLCQKYMKYSIRKTDNSC